MRMLLLRQTCHRHHLPIELCDIILGYIFVTYNDAVQRIREYMFNIHESLTMAHSRKNGFGWIDLYDSEDEHWTFSILDRNDCVMYKNARVLREWSQSMDRQRLVWFTMHGWNCTTCGNFLPHLYTSFVPPTPVERTVCSCV